MTDDETGNMWKGTVAGNQDYVTNTAFMIQRIDPSMLLSRIRKDISGTVTELIQDKEGNFFEKVTQISRPLANTEGVIHISNMVEELINTHTVQGNLDIEHYYEFIPRTREEIHVSLVINCYEWGIKDKDLEYITDKIIRIVELFLTRPMDNKERESYQKEFQAREIIQTNPKNESALQQFAGKMGK